MIFIPYGTKEYERRQTFPYVTLLLVLVNVLVFGIEISILASGGQQALNDFVMHYGAIPSSIVHGSPFNIGLLTAMFLHGGFLHIIGNMIFLLPFGDNVEDRLGHFRYLLFYLLCGFIATLAFVLLNASSTAPLIGASGAIAGILGAYLRLYPHGRVKGLFFIIILLIPITLPAMLFILYWFFIQLFSSVAALGGNTVGLDTSVAFAAHVSGFIAGYLLAPLLAKRALKQGKTSKSTRDAPEAEVVG
jgi:membrane associated rhomboid family serine protease